MRVVTTETKVYKFDELLKVVQQTTIDKLRSINVEDNWWESVYEDASNIGLIIVGFDLNRGDMIEGKLEYSLHESCDLILKNHGDQTETFAIAKSYLERWARLVVDHSDGIIIDKVLPTKEEKFDEYADLLEEEFLTDLGNAYKQMLKNAYEYLTSNASVKATIEGKGYEYTETGKRFEE